MEETKAWKTSDGKLHLTEEIAIKHENTIIRRNIRKQMSQIVRNPTHLQAIIDTICKEDSDDFIKLLFEYRNTDTRIKSKIELKYDYT